MRLTRRYVFFTRAEAESFIRNSSHVKLSRIRVSVDRTSPTHTYLGKRLARFR